VRCNKQLSAGKTEEEREEGHGRPITKVELEETASLAVKFSVGTVIARHSRKELKQL
jgi:hypothetical protein